MKYAPGRSAILPMISLAVGIRVFYGLAIDFTKAYNASWICALLGLLFCAPLAIAGNQLASIGNDSPWENIAQKCPKFLMRIAEAVFTLLLIYDSVYTARLIVNTANIMALDNISLRLLLIPLALLIFYVILLGADAQGNNTRIWLRIMPALLIILFAIQFKSFNINWITPVLGGGLKQIMNGGLRCSAWGATVLLMWFVAVPDRSKSGLFKPLLLGFASAAVLLIVTQMLSPALYKAELPRAARIELILSNGRVPLSLQLILTIIWYGSTLHLMAAEAVTAGCFIRRIVPKAPQWTIAAFAALTLFILSASDYASIGIGQYFAKYGYFVVSGGLIILMLIYKCRKGDRKNCVTSN